MVSDNRDDATPKVCITAINAAEGTVRLYWFESIEAYLETLREYHESETEDMTVDEYLDEHSL